MILNFSYKKYSGRKPQKFGSSWGGGGGGGVWSFGVILRVYKIGHSAIHKKSFFETPYPNITKSSTVAWKQS